MDTLRYALRRLASFFRKTPLDQDLDAEMAAHLEFAVEENIQRGLTPQDARRHALIRFGGVEQAKQHHRETRGMPSLDILLQDLRFAFRTLKKDRGFTIVAILILALGIGANVTVFSVVDTLLLRPLPFTDPTRLVWMEQADAKGLSGATYSVDAFDEFRQQNRSFEDVTAYMPFYGSSDYKLTGHGLPQSVSGVGVAGNFFQVLGVKPALGRFFTEKESLPGSARMVVLSNAYWHSQFAADPDIVGKAITINDRPVTVVGVMPETFDFGAVFDPGMKMDILLPQVMDNIRGDGNTLSFIGRLKAGATIGAAQAEWSSIGPRLYHNVQHPEWAIGYTATLSSLKEHVSGKLRRSLIVLWSAVGMVLLIVCVNLANLLLAREATRKKEFALRSALGAGRGRLVRQMVTESLVLAFSGSIFGIALAYGTTTWLAHQGSIALPLLSSVRVDTIALAWAFFLTVMAAIFFGLVPALRTTRSNLQEALKESGRGAGESRKHERMRSILVISEVALACVLLVCAGLLLRSFLHVLDVDLGFRPSRAGSLRAEYKLGNLRGVATELAYQRQGAAIQAIVEQVRNLPGVEAAGVSDMLPLDRNRTWGFSPKGTEYRKGEHNPGTFVYIASPGYLQAMGIHMREGRDLSWSDRPDTQQVVIINKAAANKFWPGESAIGKIAMVGGERTVIGVVDDVRETGVETAAAFESYIPVTQAFAVGAELVVRSKLPPEVLAPSIMKALRQINPDQPEVAFRPIQALVDRSTSPRRFFMILVAAFAGLGLVLASLGIYGVISYSVTQRTQEIGIRMALGASLQKVRGDVMASTLKLVGFGVVVGSIAALLAANGISSLLYGTEPGDPRIYLGVLVLLLSVAALAGYLPARRASRIDPMVALRNE
jgi:predicted permease